MKHESMSSMIRVLGLVHGCTITQRWVCRNGTCPFRRASTVAGHFVVWLTGCGFPKQIRAVPPRLFERLLLAPKANLFVIAAEQHFGDLPAAEIRWPGVVGAIQEDVIRDPWPVVRDS